jgi:hypothetical protein
MTPQTQTPPARLSESQIQSQVRHFLAAQAIDSVHFANGAVLAGDKVARAKQINKLKKAGMVVGAADLILFDRRFVRRVGFFEIKAEGGRVSPQQIAFGELATGVWGLPYAVVRSVEDARESLAEWGWR